MRPPILGGNIPLMNETPNAPAITATAPDYAPEGSRGYHLETAAGIHGWANLGDDGRTVWATLNTEPYFVAGTVADWTEFTPEWIAEHAAAIDPTHMPVQLDEDDIEPWVAANA